MYKAALVPMPCFCQRSNVVDGESGPPPSLPVTTVVQPVEDLGRHAVQLLLEDIAKPGSTRQLVLPPRLVVRGGSR